MSTKTVALDFAPFPHQRAAHTLRLATRFLVLVWHRRAGKTVFAVLELLLAALSATRERSRYAYIAPLLKQSKAVAWEYVKHFASAIPGVVFNESELSATLPNGASIRLYGADNPDGLRGLYFDGVVLDEVADMKPSVWGEILRPALADRQGWALFIGTPKGVNLFSELFYSAQSKKPGFEEWGADLRRASDTGVLDPKEIEDSRKQMTESQFAQEFDCDFGASVDNVLIRLEDVLAAQRRVFAESEYIYAPKVLGVDVARYGSDKTVLMPRQGLATFEPDSTNGASTMETAARVAQKIDNWQPDATFVDVGGVGAAVIDRLLQLGYPVTPVDFGSRPTDARFENKRAEMWWAMGDWVKQGRLPNSVDISRDLTAPTYTYKNARGRMQLESKDDMRARGLPSPDFGDALACTFAFPVVPKAMRQAQSNNQRVNHDYDPYAEVP